MRRYAIPLLVFVLLLGLLGAGLRLDPREIPSPLVGKPAPDFQLPLLDGAPAPARLSPADLKGRVWVLNVWASWCVACQAEHPLLLDLARDGAVTLVGLNYKDKDDAARRWLRQHGNPYRQVAVDADGRTGIEFGVYGVPETFVIDAQGVVRHKFVGPITPEALQQTLRPLLERLRG